MEKQIIGRGLLAGALAGVLAFTFARIFVEPVIERAIGFEDGVGEAHEAAHGGHEHGVVDRLVTLAADGSVHHAHGRR